jgi:RecA/RadA recombinase
VRWYVVLINQGTAGARPAGRTLMPRKQTEEIKEQLLMNKEKPLANKTGVSSGSTLLNLACTGRMDECFLTGQYHLVVGKSGSGKTFLVLTTLAEAAINSKFDDYDLIYDNAEVGALMDMERFYGKEFVNRVRKPVEGGYGSVTIEEFYDNVNRLKKSGKPFIYVLDSMDVLTSEEEQEKQEQNRKAREQGKETTGSYGDGKAKKNSSMLRPVIADLDRTGSILIIISQTRDNIGSFSFEKDTRSGGHALTFYATLEIWTTIREKISRVVKGKKRQIGIKSQIKIKKNRVTGRERIVEVPIYHSYGMDDTGSCVDWLISEKHWPKSSSGVKAEEFDFVGKEEKLIRHIEDNGLQNDLHLIVEDVWNDIESQCEIKRTKRY